jgi:hypothetical protein
VSKPATTEQSKSDLARVDAMADAEIIYDEDTGPPLSDTEVAEIVSDGTAARGLADFKRKMKKIAA